MSEEDIQEEIEEREAEQDLKKDEAQGKKVNKAPSIVTTEKRVKEILKKAPRPSAVLRQARAVKKMSQNVSSDKKKTQAQILEEAGYSASYARKGGVKNTQAWPLLMELYLGDEDLAKHHHQLMNASRIGTQTFAMGVKDEEIIEVIESFGFPVMKVLFVKGLGKVAYYSIPDHIAKKYALDMAYKLKQKYGDLTIHHKFGELSDEDIEAEIAGVLSEAIGLAEGARKKKKKQSS